MADDPKKKSGDADGEERPDDEVVAEKRSRLRFGKKKDMPGGLWLKCESCAQMIYRKELEAAKRVCPACGFHFTLPGRERIAMVIDEGTWEERYAELASLDRLEFNDKIPYGEKIERTAERLGQREALLCGLGAIRGRSVVLAVLDFSFMGGSMGEVVGEKIALAADLAGQLGRPLLIFTSSGGARMHEGALALMQMAKTCAALAELNDKGGFSICVMTHPTTGGVTASFASVCDVILGEPGALIGFAGPRVIATTLKQELPPGFQRAEFLLQKGMLDRIVGREELRETLARLLDYASGAKVERDRSADALVPAARGKDAAPREHAPAADERSSEDDADAGQSGTGQSGAGKRSGGRGNGALRNRLADERGGPDPSLLRDGNGKQPRDDDDEGEAER